MCEGKGLRPHSSSELTVQIGTLRSLGVHGSPGTPILTHRFFYPALYQGVSILVRVPPSQQMGPGRCCSEAPSPFHSRRASGGSRGSGSYAVMGSSALGKPQLGLLYCSQADK